MSLHQGNIENRIHTYNCYKAGLLRQQQNKHVRKCMQKRVLERSFLQWRATTMPEKRKILLAMVHRKFSRT